jgi:hypothetical protein
MNRALLIISMTIIFVCLNQPNQFSNGLIKNANKITEYFINLEIDSLDGLPQDTLKKTEKIYNKHGRIRIEYLDMIIERKKNPR